MDKKLIGLNVHIFSRKIKRTLDNVFNKYHLTSVQSAVLEYIYKRNTKGEKVYSKDIEKTFDMTQNTIKTELEKGMELNNKTRVIKQFSPDISNIASKMVANKLFELIANEEKKSE